MGLAFTIKDVQEISSTAVRAFISTFHYQSDDESDSLDSLDSDSDLSDFDENLFGCGEVTPAVESMVEDNWEICAPLEEVYGTSTSQIIKDTLQTATEETQCAGLGFFKHISPGEDQNLIATCTQITYWCCCETVKRTSPIIAEATANLLINS